MFADLQVPVFEAGQLLASEKQKNAFQGDEPLYRRFALARLLTPLPTGLLSAEMSSASQVRVLGTGSLQVPTRRRCLELNWQEGMLVVVTSSEASKRKSVSKSDRLGRGLMRSAIHSQHTV